MRARYAWASSIRLGSTRQMRSRPCHSSRTSPASSSTRKCFVIAWRDVGDFSLNRVIDSGPFVESRTSKRMRVSSPSAAKSGAASRTCATANALDRDMLLDVLELTGPTALVHAERFVAPVRGQLVEAGLDDGEQRALLRLL